jgi:hypothetical protein
MAPQPNRSNVISKGAPMFAVRMCLLLLFASSALLLTGCASNASPEDRAFFYSGWVHPNSQPPGQ